MEPVTGWIIVGCDGKIRWDTLAPTRKQAWAIFIGGYNNVQKRLYAQGYRAIKVEIREALCPGITQH
ncbi:hypothetical protein KKE60_04435 [Patescibacteria group bacterium]|nr:hypothetical protein [Patescibacteria group bacterium]